MSFIYKGLYLIQFPPKLKRHDKSSGTTADFDPSRAEDTFGSLTLTIALLPPFDMVRRSTRGSDSLASLTKSTPKSSSKRGSSKSPSSTRLACQDKAQEYLDAADAADEAVEEVMNIASDESSSENDGDSDGSESESSSSSPKMKSTKRSVDRKELAEVRALVVSANSKVSDLGDKTRAFKAFLSDTKHLQMPISESNKSNDDIVSYLCAKQQMLAAYIANLLFYLSLKITGKSVQNHPVMTKLLRLRLALEKMRSIDGKIKHQIERLVSSASSNHGSRAASTEVARGGGYGDEDGYMVEQPTLGATSGLRPNPMALLAAADGGTDDDGEGTSSEDGSDDSNGAGMTSRRNKNNRKNNSSTRASSSDNDYGDISVKNREGALYQPPRLGASQFLDNEKKAEKQAEKLKRQKIKLKRSEIFDTLREEFSSAPEISGSGGISETSGEARKLQDEANERQEYEEDRFVRLTMSRKDKKDIARRSKDINRLDRFDDFGAVGDLNKLVDIHDDMQKSSGKKTSKKNTDDDNDIFTKSSNKRMKLGSSVSTSAAMEKAASVFLSSQANDTGKSFKKQKKMVKK